MPFLGSNGLAGGPTTRPPRPAPPPPPRPSGSGSLPVSVQNALHAPTLVQRPAPRPAMPSLPAIQHNVSSYFHSTGQTHGLAGPVQSTSYKNTPAYQNAVKAVFAAQSPAQQAVIVRGLPLGGPHADLSPEANAIRAAIHGMSISDRYSLYRAANAVASRGNLLGSLGGIAHDLAGIGGTDPLSHITATSADSLTTPAGRALTAGGAAAGRLIEKLPMYTGQAHVAGQEASAAQIPRNLGKDLVNLPAEALPSVSIPISEAAQGHWGAALHTITDPYVQALKHPGQALAEHPLNTALMFAGLVHPTARAAETAGTLAIKRRLPNLQAEPIHLTANLTHERPDWSKSPITRYVGGVLHISQKAVEKQLYKRNKHGQLVPRDDQVRARLIKLETSRLVGQNERVRVAHRGQQVNAHADAVLASRGAKALHSVRTAAKYNPEPALIPGANVLARIADTTIRRPDTVEQDLRTHLQQVAANRPNLADMPNALKEHDAYVKELQAALGNKAFLRNPERAFKASKAYQKDYSQIEAQAHRLGHFRDMTAEALDRRALAHNVLTHMPRAHMDPAHGLMVGNHLLTTDEMRQFVLKETGGRMPAFTSDQPKAGDKAFFTSGQRRPQVAAQGNTYFAFQHGLTHPGHEALLEQRVRMQGIVDAHRSMNRLANQLVLQNERTGRTKAWPDFKAAQNAARGTDYVPIRLAQPFHPQESLGKALASGRVDMATLEEEAASRQLDINSRLKYSSEPGQWGLIDRHAASQLQAHENLISPNTFLRGMRGLTGQFRRVALATSFRHLPGVAQEQMLRAAAEGIGPISLLAGHAALRRAEKIDPKLGEERRIQLTGGAASGQALALQTRQVARHFDGTLLHGPLSAWEKVTQTPGPRQLGNAWRAWVKFTLQGTKHVLEQNAQISAIGKQVIADFGGRHGLLSAAMGQWGKMIDEAGHGILDEGTARRLGSYVRRVYGRWTDLTPGEQQALMFSPFGMWWTNSVAWLARMPVDHPVGAAFMAALNTGTEKQRQKLGLDMFSPGHLPLFDQGAIPVGGKLWAANYYSAFGVANNPGETAQSLFLPWETELARALGGQNWKGDTISSPANPRAGKPGARKPNPGEIATVIANSLASSFIPLYTKAQQIAQGGATSYDTSTALAPETKKANPGPVKGLKKALMPIRLPDVPAAVGSSSGGGGWGPSSSSGSGSSAPGWGGGSSGTGGWGP